MTSKDRIEEIVGFPVSTIPREEVIDIVLGWTNRSDRMRFAVCANPHSLVVAAGDGDMAEALTEADLVLPDGIGVVLASCLNRGEIKDRITGLDLFQGVSVALNGRCGGARVFFLGSSEATLRRIESRYFASYPRLAVAGSYSPPFADRWTDSEEDQMVQVVNEADADVLWVGMTAPKQEKWLARNRHRLTVPFAGAVGAVFDFVAGSRLRAPRVMQNLGLEWAFRLALEPRRLWSRSLISGPRFLTRVVADRCGLDRVDS